MVIRFFVHGCHEFQNRTAHPDQFSTFQPESVPQLLVIDKSPVAASQVRDKVIGIIQLNRRMTTGNRVVVKRDIAGRFASDDRTLAAQTNQFGFCRRRTDLQDAAATGAFFGGQKKLNGLGLCVGERLHFVRFFVSLLHQQFSGPFDRQLQIRSNIAVPVRQQRSGDLLRTTMSPTAVPDPLRQRRVQASLHFPRGCKTSHLRMHA